MSDYEDLLNEMKQEIEYMIKNERKNYTILLLNSSSVHNKNNVIILKTIKNGKRVENGSSRKLYNYCNSCYNNFYSIY
jgi:hypothetical protein